MNNETMKITLTVELEPEDFADFVEYRKAMEVQLNHHVTYDQALRSLLRRTSELSPLTPLK